MLRETELFEPVAAYLQGQGYSVHAEVKDCDVVARKGDDLVVVELKRSFSVALLVQAARRKEVADSVYVAVPVAADRQTPARLRDMKLLLRRLEVGLILVRFMKTRTRVEVALQPADFTERRRPRRRRAIIAEIDGRFAEFDTGGRARRGEQITAYKQQAIFIAWLLSERRTASPAELRSLGSGAKTQRILSQNVYGWFQRERRGFYRLSKAGQAALRRHDELARTIAAAAGIGQL